MVDSKMHTIGGVRAMPFHLCSRKRKDRVMQCLISKVVSNRTPKCMTLTELVNRILSQLIKQCSHSLLCKKYKRVDGGQSNRLASSGWHCPLHNHLAGLFKHSWSWTSIKSIASWVINTYPGANWPPSPPGGPHCATPNAAMSEASAEDGMM